MLPSVLLPLADAGHEYDKRTLLRDFEHDAGAQPKGSTVVVMDIGANDGEVHRNTYLLDVEFGWRGLCIDPFPTNMVQRSCTVRRTVVSDESGVAVSFVHRSGERDGVPTTSWNFTTSTALELLDVANAPAVIDFLSIDVGETSALRVLNSLDV